MLRFLDQVNTIVGILLFLAYLYQVFYTLYGLAFCRRDRMKAARQTPAKPSRRYAVLICARNEESVIGELISSLRAQDYPAELLDIYVLADNSTDATARVARQAGAIAFERSNPYQVGKGYALNELFSQIRSRRPLSDYDAFPSSTRIRISSPQWIEPSRRGMTCSPAIEIPRISLRAGFPPGIPSGFCARRASSTIPA